MNMINIFTDGGARGNPGPAAIGVHIVDEGNNIIFEKGEKIGVATNNIAEYKAVIAALSWLIANKKILENSNVFFYLDSELVVSQLNGIYKVKNEGLIKLFQKIRKLEAEIGKLIKYSHIPREENKKADRLVNLALDNKL